MNPRALGCLCDACPLNYLKPVLPEGNIQTAIMGIYGEAPGFQEVRQGRPFVGPSGSKLDDILREVNLKRSDVWVSNSILCRPEIPSMQGKKKYDVPTYMAWLRMENRRIIKEARIADKKANPKIYESPFICCKPRVDAELAWLEYYAQVRKQPNGAVIMPLGNFALKELCNKKSISKWRGSPIEKR